MPYCRNCGVKLPEETAFCQNCGTPVKIAAEPRLEVADWGERFVAWLIDIILIGVFLTPTKYFLAWWWPSFGWTPSFLRWVPFVDFGLDNIIYFLYWLIMEGTYGQSIGKMALKLKVTRLNGEPLDMGLAAVESIGKAFLLPIDCIIGWILYAGKNQRLFNYISETIVVKAPR
ncbi:MAG: RDD family protein [Candidatus Bathyarchaeota archaeon]|nr:RDD family protein [Candidatus Bathyarchaeota archaeon]